jgi:transposase-like protein
MNEEVKVKRRRRRYDEAFRREAVALVESSGRPLSEISSSPVAV